MWRWKKTRSLTTTVLPLVIKYTVVTRWRSPVDKVAGLGWLTVQACCLSIRDLEPLLNHSHTTKLYIYGLCLFYLVCFGAFSPFCQLLSNNGHNQFWFGLKTFTSNEVQQLVATDRALVCIVFYLNCTIDLYVKTISTGGHTTPNYDLPLPIGTQKKCTSSHINALQMLCATQGDDIVFWVFFEHQVWKEKS